MASSSVEKPAIIERFVGLIPLPYPLAALIWSAVIPSGPVFIAVQYLLTGTPKLTPVNLYNLFLNLVVTFYLFIVARYMRLRVVGAEAPIAARLSGGEQDYHAAFGKMTQTLPVTILTVAFGTFFLLLYGFTGILLFTPAYIVFTAIVVYLNTLAFSTFLWEFATASIGLHKLGGSSLRLASFQEDRMMGAKPMSNLALSFTIAYYGGLLLSFLLFSTFLPATLEGSMLFYVMLLLGVALFFLPLNGVHVKMQAEKRRLLKEIGTRYPRLAQEFSLPKENATLDDVHKGLTRLTDLQELEMLDRKVASLPTWPFDIQLVSKFITIVLSVTAVLVARLITGFLHI